MFTNSPKQLAQDKLILLYIIKNIEMPISNSQLTQIVLENDIMNYFMLQQYLGELKDSNFIIEESIDEEHILKISNMGESTLSYFINRIPKPQIEHIDEILTIQKQRLEQNTQITADYIKLKENEYLVRLKIIEDNLPIINLQLSVVHHRQAKEICKKWKCNPSKFYNQIINMFTAYDL